MKITILVFLIVSFAFGGSSKDRLPLNVKKSYDNNIRSMDGTPGENYWQNYSEYEIEAEIFPETGKVQGTAEITYYNESPDSLRKIVIRVYPNFYKKGNARDFNISPKDLTDGMNFHYIIIEGDSVDIAEGSTQVKFTATNLHITLNKTLAPDKKLDIETAWDFVLPSHYQVRMGKYSDSELFVAYWYPQIAVYDDIDGWDNIEYRGNVEFYNDFSDFEVNLTVPGDFVVWATGELQNASDVLHKDIYRRYKKAFKSDKVIQIVSQQDYLFGNVTSGEEKNTWEFEAEKITDFSFAMSDRYNWDAVAAHIDKKNKTLVTVAYPDSAPFWHEGALISKEVIEYLSRTLPGYPYPYPHMTSFCNGRKSGGMETPMMANNGIPSSRARTIGLLAHEIAHNYFPFMTGTNERKYAWMDEGWATYLPLNIVEKMEPEYNYVKRLVQRYTPAMGKDIEMPAIIPSYVMGDYTAFRTSSYARPALAYLFLKDILGDDVFQKALTEFIDRWKGKHPIPYDFFNTFENISEQDLAWFWNPWFFEFGYPDLAISIATKKDDKFLVQVEKTGNLPVPVNIVYEYTDGTTETDYYSAIVWKEGVKYFTSEFYPSKIVKKIYLDSETVPDADKSNNVWLFELKKEN